MGCDAKFMLTFRTGSFLKIMKMRSLIILLVGLLMLSGCAHIESQAATSKGDKKTFIFLCFGQSNMEGFP